VIAFEVTLCGAFAGTLLRNALPDHHVANDAKDIVRLGTGPHRDHRGAGARPADRLEFL